MVSVVTIAVYGRIYWLRLIGLAKGRRPPGGACYIRQMNRVNSRSGSAVLRWQHHEHCRGYYYYYYYYYHYSLHSRNIHSQHQTTNITH